ncbi:MAG: GspE/PulE family protein [Terriglobia bacterium]
MGTKQPELEQKRRIVLGGVEVRPEASSLLPEEAARRYLALPLRFDGQALVVALADANDLVVLDDLRIFTDREIIPKPVARADIEKAIGQVYKGHSDLEEQINKVPSRVESKQRDSESFEAGAPVVRLAQLIINESVQARASDVHLDPQDGALQVRCRVDGIMSDIMKLPKHIEPALVARFKILAGLDVAEKRKPQDGHAGACVAGEGFDLRVATLPTICGERVVIRLLRKEKALFGLDDLGFSRANLEIFKQACHRPYGLIIVSGPTGSGKSTTLYGAVKELNDASKNIVTIEDPVEYHMAGVNQVQVDAKTGLTFARGLRALLRADPDIVMVGEVRDLETAKTAVEAGLTGHLVFSTLHTNDASSASVRLIEMGIRPFLLADSAICVQAQRLVRRLCEKCRAPYVPPASLRERLGVNEAEGFCRSSGCSFCGGTGFKGRIGVHEVFLVSSAVRSLILDRAPSDEIRKVAVAEGMKTLLADGVSKALAGLTSLEEVLRVVT